VLCLVLAGGKGSRLGPLTAERSKPSLPVGGQYRLIDVALSNVVHSGLHDVWVLEQFEPHGLNEHLAGGRPWDLDRSRGGLRVLPPFQSDRFDGDDAGFVQGNAEALAVNAKVIDGFEPDVLVTMSADHLFRLDLRDVLATHADGGATVSVVATDVGEDSDRTRFTVLEVDGDRVTSMAYKPDRPASTTVATEVFAWSWPVLRDRLASLSEDGPLEDYGHRLLPSFVDEGSAQVHRHEGYWADLGVPASYLEEQLALLGDDPSIRLDDPDWPVLTATPQRRPALVRRGAQLDRAWLSPGCDVAGTVVRSVLGPGVVVEKGAEVRDSVLMADVHVGAGAAVARSVLADGVVVGRKAIVGTRRGRPVLAGPGAAIDARSTVPPGEQLPGQEA
jgi:glucose-1-phosphate adenylyltransferase